MDNRKKKKKRIRIKKIIVFMLFTFSIIIFLYKLFTTNISNIYIKGNALLTDQEIIDIAGLTNYPNSIKNNFYVIEKKLNKNKYILSSYVYKKGFLSKVYIDIKENYPLYYDSLNEVTILYNGTTTTDTFVVPTLLNQIPDTIYDKFINSIKNINKSILYKISEIKYDPTDVDQKRFLLFMNDGNYVYINLNTFNLINKYYDMMDSFDDKGILNLDSGFNFDPFND